MHYNKLVRDKIPEILDLKGISYEKRVANDLEYKSELIKKLNEEIQEFNINYDIEELADIIEVIDAIKKLSDYSNVDSVRINKLSEKGGFTKRFILSGDK